MKKLFLTTVFALAVLGANAQTPQDMWKKMKEAEAVEKAANEEKKNSQKTPQQEMWEKKKAEEAEREAMMAGHVNEEPELSTIERFKRDYMKFISNADLQKVREIDHRIQSAIMELRKISMGNIKILELGFDAKEPLEVVNLDYVKSLIAQNTPKNQEFLNSLCYQCFVNLNKEMFEYHNRYDYKAESVSAKSEAQAKKLADDIVALSKRKFKFNKLEKKSFSNTSTVDYVYSYIGEDGTPLELILRKTMEGENKRLEIAGEPFFVFRSVETKSFSDVFPIWKTLIQPDAVLETVQGERQTTLVNVENRMYQYVINYSNRHNNWWIESERGRDIQK